MIYLIKNILNVLKKEALQIDVVTYLTNTNKEFYNTHQDIIKAINNRDKINFFKHYPSPQ